MAEAEGQDEAAGQDAFLRAYLAEHDEPCPMCEYNLSGLTGTVCPECGEALRLRVLLSEPKLAAYLCGLIGLSVGVGFSGIVIAIYLLVLLSEGDSVLNTPGLPVLLFQLPFEGAAMGFWLRKRRWIRRRSSFQRWGLAAVCWAASIGPVIVFFWMQLL